MTQRYSTALIAAAALALTGTAALAESQYGYSTSTTGTVTAQAKVNLRVTVPRMVLLRVGSTNTTVDQLAWTAGFSIPGTPTTPTANANNTNVDWSGAAPTSVMTLTGTNPLSVYAWANTNGTTLNYAAPEFAGSGPKLADITVSATAGLAHPGPATLSATPTAVNLTAGTLYTGAWTYTLGGTPSSWAAGTYTTTVTYTISGT